MAERDKTSGMKSAYELALERLEQQGIERPSDTAIEPEVREQIAEIRRRTEADLAKLEILLHDRLRSSPDPADQAAAREEYAADRRRLEARREAEIEKLRGGS